MMSMELKKTSNNVIVSNIKKMILIQMTSLECSLVVDFLNRVLEHEEDKCTEEEINTTIGVMVDSSNKDLKM